MGKAMTKAATLSERETGYLEHLRQAAAQRIALTEYCRRHELVRKGLMSGVHKSGSRNGPRPAGAAFLPVRIASTPPATTMMACSIRHRSGWTIECASLPPVVWLNALVSGAQP